MLKRDRMRIFLLHGCVIALMAGCTGDLVEIGVGAKQDMSVGAAADMSQGPGGEMGPSTAKFFPNIQADLDSLGCSATGCHGTPSTQIPVMKMGAMAGTDHTYYTNFMNDVNTAAPSQSPVLTKNLPGASHGGGAKFTGTSDPIYVKWLNWISAGAPEQ